ncbi:glycoside hydrolase family 38 N-terminal domain-containing protein [Dongshaea marina]|uniref:glycoside hydrolase family 38 N-terminal domain-containing protein n=1 Tax=Dongshaea marina TaxID=2047966 RepID=UPI000D3E1296|nr:glycoside hydrolase family 38 C-terminal domain-containing protein [Dongshaea marina]
MAKVHVIPHTHWDREWYFTQQDSDVLASYNFTRVIETLESQQSYHCYHLDGQSAIVEDYLKIKPQMRERMAALVKARRLFIGPWYTQTDTYNVAAESIIRNLKYGMQIAGQLGHSMAVGYLPDTFGHNTQMPTLFKGFGIDNIIFWRGIDYDTQVSQCNFLWRSPGDEEVIAYNLVHGYGAAKNMQDTPIHLDDKIFPMVDKIRELSGLDELLLPSGGDQVNIDPRLPEILATASERSPGDSYQISSMEDYVAYLRKHRSGFETYQGELKTPRYARIHKTIGSVRYDIKKLNFEIEQFLLKRLEPVIAIARAHQIEVHTELVDLAWKKILECHAHDSMGGCNSDATNADIMHRLKQAEEVSQGLYNLVVKNIATQVCEEGEVLVFNSRIKPYSGPTEVEIFSREPEICLALDGEKLTCQQLERETLDGGRIIEVTKDGEREIAVPPYYRFVLQAEVSELPAMGYRCYQLLAEPCSGKAREKQLNYIENDQLKLSLEQGELVLHQLQSDRIIRELIRFENQADAGDSYDFSPLEGDRPIYSEGFELISCQQGPLRQEMILKTRLQLPADLQERELEQQSRELEVRLQLVLRAGQSRLEVNLETDNGIKDHRLRLLLNSDIHSEESISTLPFATINRPVAAVADDWRDRYRECPVDIETTDGVVAIAQDNRAMLVTGRGLKEYQVLSGSGQSQIALTLFKSVGVLGNNDLLWRPGRASGINNTRVFTPDAQLQKSMEFSFAISLTEQASHAAIREQERAYLHPPFGYQLQSLNSFQNRLERFQVDFAKREMPSEFSLLKVEEPLELSSIAHSLEQPDAIILRLYNPGLEPQSLNLEQFSHFARVRIVNYREQDLDNPKALVKPNNSIDLQLILREDQ